MIKPKLFIVRLKKPEEHPRFTQRGGMLAWDGKWVCTYTRGQALKKARMFNGEIIPLLPEV